jgi:predicted GNAT superfamily acetyltransferase
MTTDLEIRALTPEDDFKGVEHIQRAAWRFEDLAIIPEHMFKVVVQFGCGFAGAAYHQDRMVGFVLAFQTGDKEVHHSDMVAVDPEWQSGNRGVSVGFLLKLLHREEAMKRGVKTIHWTFDPLMSKNANLNVRKLGAGFARYLPDFYGSSVAEGLYEGISTDRMLVSWKLDDYPPKKGRTEGIDQVPLVQTPEEIEGGRVRVEIPYDLNDLKASDLEAAKAFRSRTASLFAALLARGYQVRGFKARPEEKRSFYLFERG